VRVCASLFGLQDISFQHIVTSQELRANTYS